MELTDVKDFNKKFRKLIKEFIRTHDMSTNQFCQEAGVHQSSLWMYLESGMQNRGLHTGTIEKIANYMNEKK